MLPVEGFIITSLECQEFGGQRPEQYIYTQQQPTHKTQQQ